MISRLKKPQQQHSGNSNTDKEDMAAILVVAGMIRPAFAFLLVRRRSAAS